MIKKESEKIDKYLNLTRELKKATTVQHEGDGDTNFNWCTRNGRYRIGKWIRTAGNRMKNRLQHCWGLPEYSEEFWGPEETCCRSASLEWLPVSTDVKSLKGVDVDRLYVSWKGGRGLIIIQISIDAFKQWREDNIKTFGERLITVIQTKQTSTEQK